MRIGELAKRSACSIETIRFYEKEGLLDKPERNSNGYRSYTVLQLEQLNFIRHCRSLGMGLPDVRILCNLQKHPDSGCQGINLLLEQQIGQVRRQIESLLQLEQQLQRLRDSCGESSTVEACGILKNLRQAVECEKCSCHAPDPAK